MSWKLSRTVLRGGATGNGGSLLGDKKGGSKQPFFIYRADGLPMAFAGLWERWHDKEGKTVIESCSILTTDANEMVGRLHNRMPVILEPENFDLWLDPEEGSIEKLRTLLHPAGEEIFTMLYRLLLCQQGHQRGEEVHRTCILKWRGSENLWRRFPSGSNPM